MSKYNTWKIDAQNFLVEAQRKFNAWKTALRNYGFPVVEDDEGGVEIAPLAAAFRELGGVPDGMSFEKLAEKLLDLKERAMVDKLKDRPERLEDPILKVGKQHIRRCLGILSNSTLREKLESGEIPKVADNHHFLWLHRSYLESISFFGRFPVVSSEPPPRSDGK